MATTVLASTVGGGGMPTAIDMARSGGTALDVVEAGIRLIEADPAVRSVGVGGWPDLTGEIELDASIMDGRGLRCGAVGALRGYPHAISVARQVMERLPHVLLVGDGAARFADECGFEPGRLGTDEGEAEWDSWMAENVPSDVRARWPDVPLARWSRLSADPETAAGTVTYMVLDTAGDLAAGVSTCGWARKYPGRLGDSPVAPAGAFADNLYGAAACTGQGELAIRAGTARAAVAYVKAGMTADEACCEALADLRGLRRDFGGSMTVHVMDAAGLVSVRSIGMTRPTTYWLWTTGMADAEQRPVPAEAW